MRRLIVAALAASLMLVGVAPAATAAPNRAPAPGDATIAETVVASSQDDPAEFTLLLAALEYTGLTTVFTGGGQYTVFAPTDAAFLALVNDLAPLLDPEVLAADGPFAAIDDLLGEGTVANVLLYHVTEGRRAANSVVPPRMDRSITTLLGASFSVDRTGTITDLAGQEVAIVAPNISARNGIIHVVDTVLLPLS
jgi:uncharacterized surface protein with fasciclin (FAS1) repeats